MHRDADHFEESPQQLATIPSRCSVVARMGRQNLSDVTELHAALHDRVAGDLGQVTSVEVGCCQIADGADD